MKFLLYNSALNANIFKVILKHACFCLTKRLFPFWCFLFCQTLLAQISPPGLGKANTAGWFALGLRQVLDSANHKQSVTYVGMGRISNPDDDNPWKKSAIWVINQEFYNQFKKHWQYSLAISYRRQNEYKVVAPYEKETPGIKQEFRLYGRYSYSWKNNRWKWTTNLRQEFRKFFDPDFKSGKESFQLRTRLREQVTFELNQRQRIVFSVEALFSISKQNDPSSWSDFNYRESRICLYHSYSPKTMPVVVNLGYMNNLIGLDPITDVHYIAVDIIWERPLINRVEKPTKDLE